jgi:hypothetical protein
MYHDASRQDLGLPETSDGVFHLVNTGILSYGQTAVDGCPARFPNA